MAKAKKLASYRALLITQNGRRFYFATIPVDQLFQYCYVARRDEEPEQGFQRALNESRAKDIAQYLFPSIREDVAMGNCPIHGLAGSCIFSKDLLELQPDGKVPDAIAVDVITSPEAGVFFRLNLSRKEAARNSISGNSIPLDENAYEIMKTLEEMCGMCFAERRKALETQQTRRT